MDNICSNRHDGLTVELKNGEVYVIIKGKKIYIPKHIPGCQIDDFLDKKIKKNEK